MDAGRPAAIELRRRVMACCQRNGMSPEALRLLETRLPSTFYDLNCNRNDPCVMITLVITDSRAQQRTHVWTITIDADGPDRRRGEHFGYTVERDGVRVSGGVDTIDDSHLELPQHTLWAFRGLTGDGGIQRVDAYNMRPLEGETIEDPRSQRTVSIEGSMYTLKFGFQCR